MKRYRVRLRAVAVDDLLRLHDYIEAESGAFVAAGYIERIETACRSLMNFPHRGTRRDDLKPGLRTMGFERRATIVFTVHEIDVDILRIFYGGRDMERLLRSAGDEA
ncbi:MAG: type II toxin-antitoxin system RelE/ParE family toxin [Proteobacteria bacterium]|nr:type II toxin-antitoxin system RelE/ParE family toxin [Pseudomonadota bacterium]